MPGYNVEGPGAAYSNTLEDYLTRRSREAMAQQELNQRMQEMGLRAQIEQQNLEMRKAELADKTRQRDYQTFAEQTSTMLPSDIPGSDYVERARRLGFGHLVPEAKPLPEAMPGVAALPLGPGGSPETTQPAGVNPPQPVRFAGLPEQRQQQQDIEAGQVELAKMAPNSPEARALRFTLATGYRKNLPGAGSLGRGPTDPRMLYLRQLAPNGDISQLTPDQITEGLTKVSTAGRAGGEATYTPQAVDMSAWLHLSQGNEPNSRSVGGPGNQAAVVNKMQKLQEQYHLPPLAANAASYKAWSGALTDQTKRASAMQATMNGADKTLDLVAKASPGVVRTDSQWINKTMNEVLQGLTPAVPLTDLEVKIYAAAREYAKTVTGSSASIAELSAAATAQATKLLNSAQSDQTLQAAVEAMRSDMHSYVGGQVIQTDYLRDLIGNASGPPGAYTPNPAQSLQSNMPGAEKTPAKPTSGSPLDQPATGLPADWWQRNGGR